MEDLYPFLYAHSQGGLATVMEEIRLSTAAKAAEIEALRNEVLERYGDQLVECAEAMAASFAAGRRLYAFGNGGSSTDAQDVATLYLHPPRGRPLAALSLTGDIATVTALSNDVGFEVVFARQIAAFGRRDDIAFGLSTSGGSENVIRAFDDANRRGLLTVGLAGYDGGRMAEAETIDYLFVIPSASVHRIQEAQTTVFHVLWELTQQALQPLVETEA